MTAVATPNHAPTADALDEMQTMRDAVDRARTLMSGLLRDGEQRNLALYATTGHRHFVWRTYLDHRTAGADVPEAVLSILDGWAAEPCGEREAQLARAAERRLDIVKVHASHVAAGMRPGEADAATAAAFETTAGNVRRIRSQWSTQGRGDGHEPGDDMALEAAWGMALVTPKRGLP
jgi:hypothetical protein